jgi:hypothetical protein
MQTDTQPVDLDEMRRFGCRAAVYIPGAHTIHQAANEIEVLRAALTRLRDCDWVISLPDRMDAVRDIARAALGDVK